MNKKTLSLTLGTALASTLLSAAPALHAGENPFAMTPIDNAQQLAAADDKAMPADGKMKEGKCGEGKCGAKKTPDMKVKEGSCGAKKMPPADGGGNMPENGASGSEQR